MDRPAHALTTLQPSWRRLPRLAWVISRAFLGRDRPTRLADLSALPSAALLHLPLLISARLRRHVAASPDDNAVLVVSTHRRDRVVLVGVEVAYATLTVAIFKVTADLVLGSVRTWTGFIIAAVVLAAPVALILWTALREAYAMAIRSGKAKAKSAERCTAQLRRNGHTAWTVGPWAAWPPHHHNGITLVDQLLPQVPPEVWLVAVARNARIARLLDTRGFLTPAGTVDGELLRVRPPIGQPGTPDAQLPATATELDG